ncbi:MAG: hypothetical protein P8186_02050 [Anaerolineae bacterium]|jgi:hypothetical protein
MIVDIPRPDQCWSQWVPPRTWAARVCCRGTYLPHTRNNCLNHPALDAIGVVNPVALFIPSLPMASLKDYV